MAENDQKEKNVRAHSQHPVFDGLASEMPPAKTVTSLLMLPSVLECVLKLEYPIT